MIRLLVTGRNGQVAASLAERAAGFPEIEVIALGRPDLDLERPESVEPAIRAVAPDIVVNAAAYTAVDKAESEPERAFAANRDGAAAVAQAAARRDVPLVQLSTDYVYPGTKPTPYVEGDATGPLGVYGRSKLEGEAAVQAQHPAAVILRTAWVYSPFGGNFVKTMLRIGRERDVVRVVDDQFGSPTSAIDIADAILTMAPGLARAGGPGGIYHCCGEGSTTWCGLARHIFAESGRRGGPAPLVEAIGTADYPTPARRPANSQLDMTAFRERFGFTLRPWREATVETVARLLAQG
jgi:dTDP-4-dehydrorhamnose reductase